ncbi:Small-conductance mechanosensitive channel [Halogranum gelatinilyticum]|uniref:Small-conductance mechanosensitive channel n=1 Tax=Halogranum gelatinilyticum TaxID=660521 RepID=A0A1G9SP84_9EURY|nr:mechanosensitive ion channel family protein [Halogranum gelatinilyticum]SDM37221.1 Small-conductance mechanosensitive channel [Halogranum gelatinilyticum]
MVGVNELLSTLRSILTQVTSTEARLGVSLLLLVAAAATTFVVAPRVVERGLRLFKQRVLGNRRVPDAVDEVSWLLSPTPVIRLFQTSIVVLVGLAVLVVWGREDLALFVVTVLSAAVPLAGRFGATVALLAGGVVGTRLLEDRLSDYAAGSDHINQHQQGVVFRVLQVVVLVAIGLATLTVWGQNLDGLLVGAGFLGIVVGMAARQTLGSLIAGFVLMFSRPFEIGDWVEIDGEEGIVSDITIINTRLRNFDGETIVFPNDRVSNATVTNRTRRGQLRLSLDVGVDYDVDLDHAEAVAQETLEAVDEVNDVPAPVVVPTTFGDSAIGLRLRYWIKNPSAPRRMRTNAAVVRAIKRAFDREGIKIPYPQRELVAREESNGFRVNRSEEAVERPESFND